MIKYKKRHFVANILLNPFGGTEKHMTKQDLIYHCLTYPATYEDYPFDETTTLIRHNANQKMFALIDHLNGKLQVTVKCDPSGEGCQG
jgi:hypothetical protein